ncbi:MAG: hypothetical protein ACLUHE_05365 [Christensenellales bacterium]
MNTARTLFPGAMGPDGFISCFDHLLDDSILRRKLILKAGPGVGKSTFMRRVHAALCANGEPSTLYFCSGDPDSLDGVAVPHAGLLILDGTAPHIVDPEIPGARDSIINLGECLNEPAMRPRLPHIRACMGDHAACSRRARACLAAAAALAKANAATLLAATNQARLWAMTQALVQAVLSRDAPKEAAPDVRPVITDALTPKGEISLIGENAPPRVIRLLFHWGMDGTPVLRRLSAAVQAAGYSVEEHLVPPRSGAAAAPDHPRARHARHHRRTAFRRTELRFCRLSPTGRAAAPRMCARTGARGDSASPAPRKRRAGAGQAAPRRAGILLCAEHGF